MCCCTAAAAPPWASCRGRHNGSGTGRSEPDPGRVRTKAERRDSIRNERCPHALHPHRHERMTLSCLRPLYELVNGPLYWAGARQMNRMASASPTSGSPEGRGAGVLDPRRFYRRPDVDVLAACCRYEDLPRGSEAGTTPPPPVRVSSIA